MPSVADMRTVVFYKVANMFECNACRALVVQSVFGWMYCLQKLSHLSQGMSYDLEAHAAGFFET